MIYFGSWCSRLCVLPCISYREMTMTDGIVIGDAVLSGCGRYRYTLTRTLRFGERTCVFVMLNPSTADAQLDDPTIRRCIGFAKAWDMHRLVVVNLFAWRATSPNDMKAANEPVGCDNHYWLSSVVPSADCVVCAWGKHGRWRGRDRQFLNLFPDRVFHVLGLNNDGSPKHPLYVRGDTQPQEWEIND